MFRLSPLIFCIALMSTPHAALASPSPQQAMSPEEAVRAFLVNLGDDLSAALRDDSEARERIMKRGLVQQYITREFDRLAAKISAGGGLKSLRFSAAEVRAVAWFGIVPIRQSELHYWAGKDRLRLMRLTMRPSNLALFGEPAFPNWSGESARAFGALATQTLQTMSDGDCDALNTIGASDYPTLLPRRGAPRAKTKGIMERYTRQAKETCERTTGVPLHRVTWRMGDLSGAATTRDGTQLAFKVSLTNGPKGRVRVLHIGAPTTPGAAKASE